MINAITLQLLAVLTGASILGMLIGSSAMRLHLNRKRRDAYNSNGAGDHASTAQNQDPNNAGLSINEQTQLAAQQETLQAHADLQAKRMEKLTSELHASEEKCIRLQRDFASFKANKLREVRMLKVSADEWLDNEELPVLNKKVEQMAAHSAVIEPLESDDDQPDLDQSQPIITNELDIPSLAEFELPDSVEELEFVLGNDDEPT